MSLSILAVSSECSPLYPINRWADPQCFFTVGKSVARGVVPYRDLLEQKGPYVYWVWAAASLVSRTSFVGAWLIEVALASLFLDQVWRACDEFGVENPFPLVAVVGLCSYTTVAMKSGGAVEEFLLPFLAYLVRATWRSSREGSSLGARETFFLGLGGGIAFWSKFTVCGVYVGAYVVPALVMARRDGRAFRASVVSGVAGVLTSTAPVLVYFGAAGAIPDLLGVYLGGNLFSYQSGLARQVRALLAGPLLMLYSIPLPSLLIAAGLRAAWSRGSMREWRYCLSVALFTYLSVYAPGKEYPYYATLFVPLVLLAVPELGKVLQTRGAMTLGGALVGCLACAVLAFSLTPNKEHILESRGSLPQYRFAEKVLRSDDRTMITVGALDLGFFTAADAYPAGRSFCQLNARLPEQEEAMEGYLEDGTGKFVVLVRHPSEDERSMPDIWEKVDECYYRYGRADMICSLWRRAW